VVAACDPIWRRDATRSVARRLPDIDRRVLGFDESASLKLLRLGWEEMLRQEAKLGNDEAVHALLYEHVFDINGADESGITALHIAAFRGHSRVIKALLDGGAKVNCQCQGETPLSLAVGGNQMEAIDVLLGSGADPTIRGMGGYTLMHTVARTGNADLADTLLADYGMKIETPDDEGQLPFHLALQQDPPSLGVANILLAYGQDVNAIGGGMRAIHWLAAAGDASTGHRYVKQYNLDPNVRVEDPAPVLTNGRFEAGMSPLHVAILEDKYEMVQMLAKVGASLSAQDGDGRTPMQLADLNGKRDIVAVLVEGEARDAILKQVQGSFEIKQTNFADGLAVKIQDENTYRTVPPSILSHMFLQRLAFTVRLHYLIDVGPRSRCEPQGSDRRPRVLRLLRHDHRVQGLRVRPRLVLLPGSPARSPRGPRP
jgi:ankyrin repeat protein